jgi:UDP-glucose 4-epimerase
MKNNRIQKVLVTGGAGFIGSHVVEKLQGEGLQVCVLDDLSSGKLDNLDEQTEFELCDITDQESVNRIVATYQPDCIIHMAALVDVTASMAEPIKAMHTNIDGTINIVQAAKWSHVSRFIFASTYCVYGTPEFVPVTEAMRPVPNSVYGKTKLVGERICESLADSMDVVIVRGSNTYGPRQMVAGTYGGVIPIFFNSIINNKQAEVRGNGQARRDFVYVEDAAEFYVQALGVNPGLYNYGSGKGRTIDEVWNIIAAYMDGIHIPTIEPKRTALREGEIREIAVSFAKAKFFMEWQPQVSFEDGIARTLEYMLSQVVYKAEVA